MLEMPVMSRAGVTRRLMPLNCGFQARTASLALPPALCETDIAQLPVPKPLVVQPVGMAVPSKVSERSVVLVCAMTAMLNRTANVSSRVFFIVIVLKC